MHIPLLLLSLCVTPLLKTAPPVKPVADRDMGLSRTSVFDVPAPPAFKAEDSAPGDKALPKRINPEYPPIIPHGTGDCLPITRASNLCLDCHAVPGPKKQGEATPIPGSHYINFRVDPKTQGKQVAGARYVCISCHVERTDAPPLVGSRYRP